MKTFSVPVSFTFSGVFKIKAANQAQANEFAEKHCGMVAGRGVHSSLPDGDVDWDFPVHPEKYVGDPEDRLGALIEDALRDQVLSRQP